MQTHKQGTHIVEGELVTTPTAGEDDQSQTYPDMTAEEIAFTRLVAKGITPTTAYRKAFPKALNQAYGTVRNKASALMTKHDIVTEIATARDTTARLARLAEDRIEQILTEDNSQRKGSKVAEVAMFMYEQANGKATQRIEQTGQYVTVVYDLSGKGEEVPEHIKQQLAEGKPTQ